MTNLFACVDRSGDTAPTVFLSAGIFFESTYWDYYEKNTSRMISDLQAVFAKVRNNTYAAHL